MPYMALAVTESGYIEPAAIESSRCSSIYIRAAVFSWAAKDVMFSLDFYVGRGNKITVKYLESVVMLHRTGSFFPCLLFMEKGTYDLLGPFFGGLSNFIDNFVKRRLVNVTTEWTNSVGDRTEKLKKVISKEETLFQLSPYLKLKE